MGTPEHPGGHVSPQWDPALTAVGSFDALTVRDPSGPPSPPYPAQLGISNSQELNRWLPLVKWPLVIPYFLTDRDPSWVWG